jgi:hypothetical protein
VFFLQSRLAVCDVTGGEPTTYRQQLRLLLETDALCKRASRVERALVNEWPGEIRRCSRDAP